MEIGKWDLVYLTVLMILVSFSTLFWVGGLFFEPKTDYTIYLEDVANMNNRGIRYGQICVESVNTWMFVCDNNSWNTLLYNITQEDFDKLITECPTGKLIKSSYCIGDYLDLNNYEK